MDNKQRVTISKFLSKHLRHEPEALGLTLAEGGWVDVASLLAACAKYGFPLTGSQLDEVVQTSDKQRFAFDETGRLIRANQGHSTAVDLQLQPVDPPALLYHGSTHTYLTQILAFGLLKMKRHHVHLSLDVVTARRVGQRHGKPVVLSIDSAAMHTQGHEFFVAANGVWLTDHLPARFLTILD